MTSLSFPKHAHQLGGIKIPQGSDQERHFLVWYEYNEGNNIICSSTLEGLSNMYSSIIQKYGLKIPPKIKHYYIGKYKNIPHSILRTLAEEKYNSNKEKFIWDLLSPIHTIIRDKMKVPNEIEICDKFVEPDDWNSFSPAYLAERLTDIESCAHHIAEECQTCNGQVILKIAGKTIEEIVTEHIGEFSWTPSIPDYTPNDKTFFIETGNYNGNGSVIMPFSELIKDVGLHNFRHSFSGVVAIFEGEEKDCPSEFISRRQTVTEALENAEKERKIENRLSRKKDLQEEFGRLEKITGLKVDVNVLNTLLDAENKREDEYDK